MAVETFKRMNFLMREQKKIQIKNSINEFIKNKAGFVNLKCFVHFVTNGLCTV